LLVAGVLADTIRSDLAVGRYYPVHRGVYAIGPLSPRGQLQAAIMAGEPHGSLCFASGLAPYNLMAVKSTIDIAVPTNRRDSDRLRFHRVTSLNEDEVTRRDGLRTTTIERTLLDLASINTDIAKLAHEAIAKRLTTQPKLQAIAQRHPGHHGTPALLAQAQAPHTRSNLERQFLQFLDDYGLPRPLTNHPIGPYTVDGYYPQAQLVIELDEDAHKSAWAFEQDRKRDRYLASIGLRVMRITATSLDATLARELRRALTAHN
jgi:very-short-patch-repair endonuclease